MPSTGYTGKLPFLNCLNLEPLFQNDKAGYKIIFPKKILFSLSLITQFHAIGANNPSQHDEFFATNSLTNELSRMVYDGSFQYAIPSSAKLQIDQSFCEQNYTSSVEHQVHLTDPTDSISLKLRIEDSYISLEEWANRQKNSWLFSEIGEMNYGQKFINEAGFAGIVMLREQNNIEEIIIGIDLTTEEWKKAANLGQNHSSNQMLLCTLQLSTQERINGNIMMAIAKSIDYKISPTFEPSSFTEKLGTYSFPKSILDREFTSSGLMFKATNDSLIKVEQSFSQIGQSTFGKFEIFPNKTKANSIFLELKTEKDFKDLQQWAQIRRNSWDQSDDSEITLAQSLTTHFGYPSISLAREKYDSRGEKLIEFEIVVDLTFTEWRESFLMVGSKL